MVKDGGKAGKSKGLSKRKHAAAGTGSKKAKKAKAKERKSDGEGERHHWDREFHDVMQAMLSDDSTWEILGSLLLGWDLEKVQQLISDWRGEALGVILGSWRPKALSKVLSCRASSLLLKCCECWKAKKIGRFLARCTRKKARKVMSGLYFATSDPYLSHREARVMLAEWSSHGKDNSTNKALRSLCRDWDKEWVDALLSGKDAEQHARRVRGGGDIETDSESYDSSFIDDGSELEHDSSPCESSGRSG